MAIDFSERLNAHLDRKDGNDVTLDKMVEVGFVEGGDFRSAVAARMLTEAGSGRTRAETNLPAATSAAGNAA